MRVRYIGNKPVKHYRFGKQAYSFERNKWVNIEWADQFLELQRYPDTFECEMGFNVGKFKELHRLKRRIRFEGQLIKTEDPGAIKKLKQSGFVKFVAKLGRATHVFRIINYVDPEYLEFVGRETESEFGIIRRLGGWGDVQMVLGALPGFKKRYPNSKVTFACPPEWLPLAENNPYIDRAVTLLHFSKLAHFDGVVDVTDPCLRNEIRNQPNVTKNRVESFAEALNCRVENPVKEVYLTEEEVAETDKADLGDGPVIGLVPKSNAPVRNWGKFRQLSEDLHREIPDAKILIISAENVWKPRKWEKLYLKAGLRTILPLLNRCNVVVGPDTGPMHSASQLGVPTVWVFTHIDGDIRTKNYEKVRIVQDKSSCPKCPCWYMIPCSKNPRKDRTPGVLCSAAIKIEDVRYAVIEQIECQESVYDRKAKQIFTAKTIKGIVSYKEDSDLEPASIRINLTQEIIMRAKGKLASAGLKPESYKVGLVPGVASNEVLEAIAEKIPEKSLILFDKFDYKGKIIYIAFKVKQDFNPYLNECDIVIGPPSALMHSAAGLGVSTLWLTTDKGLSKLYPDAVTLKEVNVAEGVKAFKKIYKSPTLSYVIVCHNCFDITKRCIESVKAFKKASQEIVLIDNASTDWTKAWGPAEKDIRYVKMDKNYGCIVGRNKGIKEAKGKWLFILDNDQYISPHSFNALFNVQADIAGAEAWSMDRGGWAHPLCEKRGPLAYVGGGGILIRKEVMEKLGYLDERYAPAWFSDPDICFTAREKGYSIGYAENHGIHHEAHKTVFSQKTFDHNAAWRASFEKFKQKWEGVLKFGTFLEKSVAKAPQVSKPKIMLAADVKGWAWWYKSNQIQQYLSDEFQFFVKCLDQQGFNGKDQFDLYFTFGTLYINRFNSIPRERKMTGITAVRPLSEIKPYINDVVAVHANSLLLYNVLNKLHDRCYYVPNGVDISVFKPDRLAKSHPFTVAHIGKPVPKKGFDTIVKPMMSKLQGVQLTKNRKHYGNAVPAEEMAKFYQTFDVLIVSSTIDGTPCTALEAAATGKTIVSNKIGNMPEFIEDGINGFLVNLKVDEYVAKIEFLRDNPDRCREMGQEALKTVHKDWTWKAQAENYRNMFREVLHM